MGARSEDQQSRRLHHRLPQRLNDRHAGKCRNFALTLLFFFFFVLKALGEFSQTGRFASTSRWYDSFFIRMWRLLTNSSLVGVIPPVGRTPSSGNLVFFWWGVSVVLIVVGTFLSR
jgi:hypothetical protein